MKQPRSTVKHDVGTYILSRCMRQFHETAGSPANTSFPPLVSLFLIFDDLWSYPTGITTSQRKIHHDVVWWFSHLETSISCGDFPWTVEELKDPSYSELPHVSCVARQIMNHNPQKRYGSRASDRMSRKPDPKGFLKNKNVEGKSWAGSENYGFPCRRNRSWSVRAGDILFPECFEGRWLCILETGTMSGNTQWIGIFNHPSTHSMGPLFSVYFLMFPAFLSVYRLSHWEIEASMKSM